MAQAPQSHNPANPPNATAPGTAPPHTSYPGGMASDPALALANEIATNIKGAPDRFRSQMENAPALKALFDQSEGDLLSSIAQAIRRFADGEVAKATGGMVPAREEKKPS